jgi:hypothetical protein
MTRRHQLFDISSDAAAVEIESYKRKRLLVALALQSFFLKGGGDFLVCQPSH